MPQDTLQDDLRRTIISGQAVVIVGAGVSMGATNRHLMAIRAAVSWGEFLRFTGVGSPAPLEAAAAAAQTNGHWQDAANCILRLGDLALQRSAPDEAQSAFTQALELYRSLPEPYSIGNAHHRLARLCTERDQQLAHLQAARTAWASIDRADLVAELEGEFGEP